MTHRRYHLLHKSLKHTIRTYKQLQQSLCTALSCQENKMIEHKLNMNLHSEVCHMVHPTHQTPSQLFATTTTSQAPGLPLFTTYAITILTQLTGTHNTYSRQLGPPPGISALFYATRTIDDAGTRGVTIHPHRIFTVVYLAHYHPLAHLFDHNTKQRFIQVHHNRQHIFAPVSHHNTLSWPPPP